MGERTPIEWTDATWNPLRGCSRVSAGCEHCYAEQVARRFSGRPSGRSGGVSGLEQRGGGDLGPPPALTAPPESREFVAQVARLSVWAAWAEGHVAQLQDQRDEALARRDELFGRLLAAQEAVGEAWLRASAGDLAEAVRRKTLALEALIHSVVALEGDVFDAAQILADAVAASLDEGHPVGPGTSLQELLAGYREARAALDAHGKVDEPAEAGGSVNTCGPLEDA